MRNERIRETVKVGPMVKKIQESRLRWFGHVKRRDESYVGKKVEDLSIEGRRKKGRPELRWRDKVEVDLREKGFKKRENANRGLWRGRIKKEQCRPQIKLGKG